MSPLIFTTDPDYPNTVEIANTGVLAGNGDGGIPVERAARTLHELQGDDGEPLTGQKLERAARAWAEDRGLRVRSVKNVDEEALRVAAGGLPDGPTIEEIANAAAERDRAVIEEAEVAPDEPPPPDPTKPAHDPAESGR